MDIIDIGRVAPKDIDRPFYLPSTGEDCPDDWPMTDAEVVRGLTGGPANVSRFVVVAALCAAAVWWVSIEGTDRASIASSARGDGPTATGSIK